MTGDTFPDHSARGITIKECVDGKSIRRCVFTFEKSEVVDRKEISIQWLDNQESVKQMKSRMKNEHPQFILGFAVLKTSDLEELKYVSDYRGMDYIRSPSSGNNYHGLITITPQVNARLLAAELAIRAEKFEFSQELPVG